MDEFVAHGDEIGCIGGRIGVLAEKLVHVNVGKARRRQRYITVPLELVAQESEAGQGFVV
jgi:hypothetical protein